MIKLPLLMSIAQATAIAGTLSRTKKMPGYSYSLDARRCPVGSRLRDVPGSTCYRCYAFTGFYVQGQVRGAQQRRYTRLGNPRWADAMAVLIHHHCRRPRDRYFRWFDSGDLQSLDHLRRVVEVCERTPQIKHWLQTKEYACVAAYLRAGDRFPDNLVVRLSAYTTDRPPQLPRKVAHLPTSTVHTSHNPVPGKSSIECRATVARKTCGRCRACWDPRVINVSYRLH